MTWKSEAFKHRQLIADYANKAQELGLISMSAVPGFAVPNMLMAGGLAAGTYTYRTHIIDTANATTYSGGSWNTIAIGTADVDRHVILGIYGATGTATVSSCTIGGVAAALVTDGSTNARIQNSTNTQEFWIAKVPSGTTANISITWSGAQLRCSAGVWTGVLHNATAIDVDSSTAASGANVTLNTHATGFILAIQGSGDSNTVGWTNVSERFDATVESTAGQSGADAATVGASIMPTATWSGAGGGRSLLSASFRLRSGAVNPPRILDGYSNVTGAWSISRQLLSSFGSGARYSTVGSNVASIANQTGDSANDFTQNSSTSFQPALQGSLGTQARTGARFDGSDNYMLDVSESAMISASAGYIVVCAIVRAVTSNSATPSDNDSIIMSGGTKFGIYLRNNGSAYSWGVFNDDGAVDSHLESGVTYVDVVRVFEWRHEGGTLYGRMSTPGIAPGAWASVASGDTSALSSEIHLGTGTGGTNFTQVDILEVVTFNGVPNDTLKDALVTNMLAHYG